MRVLIACSCSGTTRDYFTALGHDATSCDLKPSATPGPHYQGDVRDLLHANWDLMIAHPPCTHLSVSGARWFPEKRADGRQQRALSFVGELLSAPIPRICVENPVSILSTVFRKPDQIIQPWQYGHGETKTTCLWLKGLPDLVPTNIVPGRESRIHKMPPSDDRGALRSMAYDGISRAMAEQWGALL